MRITEQVDELGKLTVPTLAKYDYGKDKQAIIDYMINGKLVSASSAKVFNYIAGCEYDQYCRMSYTDNAYEWNTNDILYIELYDMAINEDFIKQIIGAKAEKPVRKTRKKADF